MMPRNSQRVTSSVLVLMVFAGALALPAPKAQACPRPPDEILFSPDPNAIQEWCNSSISFPGFLCGHVGAAPLLLAGLMTVHVVSGRRNRRGAFIQRAKTSAQPPSRPGVICEPVGSSR